MRREWFAPFCSEVLEGKKAELTSGLRASIGKGTYGVDIIGNFNKN